MIDPLEQEHEKALLRDWARGGRASGEELLRRLLPGIYGLCLKVLKKDADAQDAAQSTFAKLCEEVRKGVEIQDVRKWTATVAINGSIDLQRRRGREVPLEVEPAAAPEAEPLERAELDALRRWIDDLPQRYRLVLHYHFGMGMKPAEIADIMKLEPGTARVLLHRAVAALRKNAGK